MQFGEKLRQARLDKKLTLNDVEAATKIRVQYLEALETENIPILPGKAYAIGFLKTYAKFLNIAYEDLLAELKTYYQEPVSEESNDISITPVNTKSKFKYFLMVVSALLFIVILMIIINYKPTKTAQTVTADNSDKLLSAKKEPESANSRGNKQNTLLQANTQNNPSDNVQQTNKPDSDNNIPMEQGQKVVLRAKDRVWVSVSTDGKKIFEGIILKDQEKAFTGKVIKVKLGNALSVKVIHNGIDLGILSTDRKVITKIFTQ